MASRLLVVMPFLIAAVLFTGVGHAPDTPRAIVGDVKRTVLAYRDAYRAAPDVTVGSDEACEKVFIFAGCLAILHGDANDLIAAAVRTVPRPVLCGKSIAIVLCREAGFAFWIERHSERGHVRLDEDV